MERDIPRAARTLTVNSISDIVVLTPTYNRLPLLKDVCRHLVMEAGFEKKSVHHIILDDCSDVERHPYAAELSRFRSRYYSYSLLRTEENCGRFDFHKVWNLLMDAARREKWDLAIAIPDDDLLCRSFLRRTVAMFRHEQRIDRAVCCMNIAAVNLYNWRMDRWIDGAFICDRRFFDALDWDCSIPSDWFGEPGPTKEQKAAGLSAYGYCAGWVMSKKLQNSTKAKIAPVRDVSFIKPRRVPSAMFPASAFPKRPILWGRENFIDG